MTLIFGRFGAFSVPDVFFAVLAFFFFGAAFDVARFTAGCFADAVFAFLTDAFETEAFTVLALAVLAGFAATAAGTGAVVTVAAGGGVGAGVVSVAGAAMGATFPVETDVVVLLACCVPFVAPNSPVMKGFAMQS